ncbi:MAG: extracellular solute-binding protein [Anaerolineae bacterium]
MSSQEVSRRSFLRTAVILGGTTVLAACSATPTPQAVEEATKGAEEATQVVEEAVTATAAPVEPVLLRFGWWIQGGSPWYRCMETVVGMFEERTPGIKIQLEASGWGDYWQRVQVQLAGGEAMDILWTAGDYFVDLQEKGAHLDLTPYVERDGFDVSLYLTEEYGYPEGKTYTMPYSGWAAAGLVYNMYAFDEAGLAYPTNDWTWDDWRDAAIKLTKRDSSGNVTQWGAWTQTGFEYGWLRYVRHNGANWINEEKTKTTMDDPKAVEALQWIADNMFVHKCSPNREEQATTEQRGVIQPFLSGMCAMGSNNDMNLGILREEGCPENVKPQIVRMPTVEKGGIRWFNGNTNPVAVFSGTKYPEESWQWLLFLASPESLTMLITTRANSDTSVYKPLNRDDKVGFLQPIPGVEHLDLSVYADMVEANTPGKDWWTGLDYHSRSYADWTLAVEAELDYLWLGEKKAEEACAAATVAGDQVMAEG